MSDILCPKCKSKAQRIGSLMTNPLTPIYGCAACGHDWSQVDAEPPLIVTDAQCIHEGRSFLKPCPVCALEVVRKERDEMRADLQNLRDILLSQIPLTKEPGTNVELLRQLVQQRDSARAKAIQFDLDRVGIEQRAAEAAELVDLRAEVERLRAELEGEWLTRSKRLEEDGAKLLAGLASSSLARLRAVAERQREACAAQFDIGPERKRMWASLIRKTPLVTEDK
jgi:hypothetical protein